MIVIQICLSVIALATIVTAAFIICLVFSARKLAVRAAELIGKSVISELAARTHAQSTVNDSPVEKMQ